MSLLIHFLTHSCPIKILNFLFFAALNCYNSIINYIFQIKLVSMFAGLLVIILKQWENNCNPQTMGKQLGLFHGKQLQLFSVK